MIENSNVEMNKHFTNSLRGLGLGDSRTAQTVDTA